MNEYRWGDLHVGLKAKFEASFTREDLTRFAELSGDVNPLHVDEAHARAAGFPGPVVFGMLSSSLYSRLAGVYLPGKFALLQGIDIDFKSPCFANERLFVEGEIVFLSDAVRQAEIKATIRREDGKQISKARIRVGLHGQ